MAVTQVRRHCRYCKRYTLHEKHYMGCGMGLLLTLVTGGLFLPLWAMYVLLLPFSPYRCQQCGGGRLT